MEWEVADNQGSCVDGGEEENRNEAGRAVGVHADGPSF